MASTPFQSATELTAAIRAQEPVESRAARALPRSHRRARTRASTPSSPWTPSEPPVGPMKPTGHRPRRVVGSPARASDDREGHVRDRGHADHLGRRGVLGPRARRRRRRRRAASGGRGRRLRQDEHADLRLRLPVVQPGVRDAPTTRGTSTARRAAPPAARRPRSPPGSPRSSSGATSPGRSAHLPTSAASTV